MDRIPLLVRSSTEPHVDPNTVPPTSPYRVVVASLSGTRLNEVPVKNLNYSYVLNGPGTCTFTLPLLHPQSRRLLLDPGARVIEVWREQTRVWSGPLWSINASKDGGVQCSAQGWLSALRRRYIDQDLKYNNVDQFDLAWNLINFTQQKPNGDLGITRYSAAQSGVQDDITYVGAERKNLGDALTELGGQINGFDFEITADRQWRAYYPSKGTQLKFSFVLGKNISGVSWVLDASNLATEVTSIGGQNAKGRTLLSVASDAASQDRYGLLQSSTSYSDVIVQGTLDRHAQDDLNVMKLPTDNPQLQVFTSDPAFGSYTVGDIIPITADNGFIQFDNSPYRITSIVVAVSDEGQDNIGVFFDPTE